MLAMTSYPGTAASYSICIRIFKMASIFSMARVDCIEKIQEMLKIYLTVKIMGNRVFFYVPVALNNLKTGTSLCSVLSLGTTEEDEQLPFLSQVITSENDYIYTVNLFLNTCTLHSEILIKINNEDEAENRKKPTTKKENVSCTEEYFVLPVD